MADELVEKVALASCRAGVGNAESGYCQRQGWCVRGSKDEQHLECYVAGKRTIVAYTAALAEAGFGVRRREPTSGMIEAAIAVAVVENDGVEISITQCWAAMFDHPSASPAGSANEKGER